MRRLFSLFAVLLIASGAVSAQPQSSDSPPLIAGRLSLAEGDAQIWRVEDDGDATDGEWDTAQVNDVVTVGTGLYTGTSGRTELRVGPNTLRLASSSRGGFSQLDYDNAVFNLEHGSLNIRLARAEHGEATAVTVGGMQIDLAAPGRYRIDAGDGSGQARVTVFSGHAAIQGASPINVAAGQALIIGPGLSSVDFDRATATAFDQWALARDDRYANVRSAQYVSAYMTGYEELDSHGDWIPDATYGNVWVPRVVPVGWAPYRHGQWRWVRPWGWTWVDHAPWGYAPFHYGRWVTINNRWCWWPGVYHRRPVWAPALVGFVGGSHVSVSVGFGGPVVGWYPLAPWHHYRPHYRHNHHYTTIINQTVINHSPRRGLSRTPPNTNPEGTTMVPGPRFRDPVMKVALPVGSDIAPLRPTPPPPKTIAPVRRVAEDMVRGPNQAQPSPKTKLTPAPSSVAAPVPAPQVVPAPKREIPAPTRVMPPMAEPIPNRGVTPQPPLPGNDPAPLAQPPKFNRVPPTAIQTTPPPPRPAQEMSRPAPRARVPQELLPQAEQKPQIAPAEPARFPPGAPPTIRQPQIKTPVAQPAPQAAPPVVHRAPPPRPAPEAPPMVQRAPAPQAAPPVVHRAPPPRPAPEAPPMVQRAPAPQPAPQLSPSPEPRGKQSTTREVSRAKER